MHSDLWKCVFIAYIIKQGPLTGPCQQIGGGDHCVTLQDRILAEDKVG